MPGLNRMVAGVMGAAARRPLRVALLVGALAVLAGGFALLTLKPSAATEQFVGDDSASARATDRHREAFGEDAIIVLVKGDLARLVLTADLQRLIGFEGCISGNAPRGVQIPGGPDGPCGRLARTKPVKVVFGPATFINESVRQISEQFGAQLRANQEQAKKASDAAYKLARGRGYSRKRSRELAGQAAQVVQSQFTQSLLALGLRYGLRDIPRINDPNFVSQLVFDATKPAGTPKERFAYLFPTRDSALIQVRLKPGLSEEERSRAIDHVRAATRMEQWRLQNGGRYVVTGAPVVVDDLTESISSSIILLLLGALLVMALTLRLVFRARLRLLPLGVALAATALTFGGLALTGASLTMASIGVLPVLIGLAVDYAIQVQSRIQERGGAVRRAVAETASDGAPTVAVAAAATAAGFLVLLLSPVPLVRGFGLLLVAGIVLALLCALSLGVAGIVAAADGRRVRLPGAVRDAAEIVAEAGRDAGEILAGNRVVRRARAALSRRGDLASAPAFGPQATRASVRRTIAGVLDLLPLAALAVLLARADWTVFATVLTTGAAAILYLGVLPGATGWSPGKLLLGLRVVDRRGRPPGVPAGVVRTLGLTAGPFGARRSPWRQRRGDRLAGTLVVRRARLDAAGGTAAPPRAHGLVTGAGIASLAAAPRPRAVLLAGLAVAVLGWGLDTQTGVESDIQKLVPKDLAALQDLDALQRSTGVGGNLDVLIRSDRLIEPEVVQWMVKYQGDLLKRFGFSSKRGCGEAELCPAFSLPDLFRSGETARSKEQITQLLDAVPAYFSQGVITADRKTATLAFGIRLMPLERQHDVIEAMRDGLSGAPDGVTAEVAGLPVLAAEANDAVASPLRRLLLIVAGLAAVLLVLLVAFRDLRRAVVPLVPIALATGWAGLLLFVLRVELNPMSVTLGALVVAISTEFSVLLSERFRRERLAGHDVAEALRRTYRSTGRAVLASGATAIAGFAVLVFSDIRMLRDFGAVTVVDLTVSLLAVLVVLPSVLVLAERPTARSPVPA